MARCRCSGAPIGAAAVLRRSLTFDGSLRTFALVTLLNLPSEMLPDVVLLDEPELGLHPSVATLIGGMISSLSGAKAGYGGNAIAINVGDVEA